MAKNTPLSVQEKIAAELKDARVDQIIFRGGQEVNIVFVGGKSLTFKQGKPNEDDIENGWIPLKVTFGRFTEESVLI